MEVHQEASVSDSESLDEHLMAFLSTPMATVQRYLGYLGIRQTQATKDTKLDTFTYAMMVGTVFSVILLRQHIDRGSPPWIVALFTFKLVAHVLLVASLVWRTRLPAFHRIAIQHQEALFSCVGGFLQLVFICTSAAMPVKDSREFYRMIPGMGLVHVLFPGVKGTRHMQWTVYMVLNAIANSEPWDAHLLLVAMLMNTVIFATVALLSVNWASYRQSLCRFIMSLKPPTTTPDGQGAPASTRTSLTTRSAGHSQETAVLEDFKSHLLWLQNKLESQQRLMQRMLATSGQGVGLQGHSAVETNRVMMCKNTAMIDNLFNQMHRNPKPARFPNFCNEITEEISASMVEDNLERTNPNDMSTPSAHFFRSETHQNNCLYHPTISPSEPPENVVDAAAAMLADWMRGRLLVACQGQQST